jgi:four helix bundle protein
MLNLNPYDIKSAVQQTGLDVLEQDPLCQLAHTIATEVQQLYRLAAEQPRFAAIFDQAQRASSSIFLNIFQGYGKVRGFLSNDLLCARAEAFESYAALSLFPKGVGQPIKNQIRELLTLLDERILAIPDKPFSR